MRQLFFIGFAFLVFIKTYGQINMSDSTVQVIGYWNKHDKQTYTVTNENYKVKDSDTTSRESYKYVVDITIVDSTADSYTIDWFYHDYDIQAENELIKKLSSIAEDMTVTIITDDLGAFIEVVNWKDIRDYIFKATKLLKKEEKDIPGFDKLIEQMEQMYNSKEAIEASAIKEIQQFYTYHGAKYKLGEEITASMEVPNLYGSEPFDTEVILWLDEINTEDNNSIIRMQQIINSEQLTKTTFDYLTKISGTMNVPGPKWDDFPKLSNETWTSSRIHNGGWVVYSVETQKVSAEGVTNVKENTIEIQ
ncbi:MAG: hypothetical protein Q7U54_18455 [Bacteroidales bacterium]|nr:hypothetical protein [Bacteroidales bacterium]